MIYLSHSSLPIYITNFFNVDESANLTNSRNCLKYDTFVERIA